MEPCPFCQGTGTRRNMEWQAVQALADLRRKMRDASDSGQTGLVYTVEPELAWYLLNQKRSTLAALEKDLGLNLEIRPARVG
jgi:ribonuclease E